MSDTRENPDLAGALAARPERLVPWALILVTGLVYANALLAGFHFDSVPAIAEKAAIRQWPSLTQLFEGRKPLLELSFALNYQIENAISGEGLEPRGYHLFNVAIHVLAGLVLFGLARRTIALAGVVGGESRRGTLVAGAVALLWLVHPLATQAVTYTVQRAESMSELFALLALYGIARLIVAPRAWGWGLLTVVAALAGVGTKLDAAVIPLLVIAYDWTFGGSPLRRRLPLYLGLFGTWLLLPALGLGAILAGRHISVGFGVEGLRWWEYVWTQPEVILHYLRLAFWPDALSIDYFWRKSSWPADAGAIVASCATVLVLLAVSAWGLWRRRPWGFCGAAFFLPLAPTSLVPLTDLAMEHRVYLPLAALVGLVVVAAATGLERLGRGRIGPAHGVLWAAVAVVAVGLGTRTVARNDDYVSGTGLWASAVAVSPHNVRAWNNLGVARMDKGNPRGAIRPLERAVSLKPSFIPAQRNLGKAYLRAGMPRRAIEPLRRALARNPEEIELRARLGRALLRSGELGAAAEQFARIRKAVPDRVSAINNLGVVRLRQERLDEAARLFRAAAERDPDLARAWGNLGDVARARGELARAEGLYRKALTLEPNGPRFHIALGGVLAERGKAQAAIEMLTRALPRAPASPHLYRNLVRAMAAHEAETGVSPAERAYRHYRRVVGGWKPWPEAARRIASRLATTRDASLRHPAAALRLARGAAEARGGSEPEVLITLAVCQAAAGDRGRARRTLGDAIELARALGRKGAERRARRLRGRVRGDEPVATAPATRPRTRPAAAR